MTYRCSYNLVLIALLFFFNACNTKNDRSILFSAQNTTDWSSHGDANWNFNGEELNGNITEGAGFAITKETYTNFELQLEFNPDRTINSGVFIRCKDREISNTDCYEFNIWDEHPNQDNRTGAIVTRTTPLGQVQTIDKWNTYKIRVQGDQIQAWINTIEVVNLKNSELSQGYIGLQAAGKGKIAFRNVTIESL